MTYKQDSGYKAVFLDRDGTINEEVGYLSNPDNLRILPRAAQGIKLLNAEGFKVIVITNQSGVARGYFTEEDVQQINKKTNELIMESGAIIDGFYYCPHHPQGIVAEYQQICKCRKPEPGLLLHAASQLNINLSKSFIVGDKLSDLQMAETLGAQAVLVLTGYGREEREKYYSESSFTLNYIAKDLLDAVHWIIRHSKKNERKN